MNYFQKNFAVPLDILNGGTFYGRNPALGDDNLGGTFVAEGKTCIQQADGSYVVVSLDEAAENAVALVNGAAYTDLAAAIAAANAVEGTALVKVEVLQDATVTGITLTRDNVTLAGLGADQTKIVITQNVWAQGGIFLNGANGITIEGLTIELTDTSARAAVIKATFNSDGETDYSDLSENVTLRDLVLIGNESSGGGINLHGVKNVVVDSVRIENKYGVGISLAYATDVEISNVTFTNESGWGDIGMMYAADNPDYVVPVKGVTLGENIEFAAYHIYAENLSYEMDYSAYSDVFGLVESENRWDLVNVIAASITKDGVTVNYATVQGAINAAETGDVVEIKSAEFTAPIQISKNLTIKGMDGMATLNFENCAAIQIMADVDLTLENITLFTNDAQGTEAGANAGIACGAGNLTVNQAVNLTLTNVTIDGFDYGIYLWAANSADNKKATIKADNLTVQNSLVKGIYAENLTDSTFTNCSFIDNGTDADLVNNTFKQWVSGVDINLKYGDYENIAFTNCTFEGNGDNDGAALLLKARDDGATYGANPATLTGVTVTGCTFENNNLNIVLGELRNSTTNIVGNRGPVNVTIDDESLISRDNRFGRSISTVEQLTATLAAAQDGDTLYLTSGHFALPSNNNAIVIDKSITIVGATEEEAVYANDVVASEISVTSGTLITRSGGINNINLITVNAENVTFRNLTFDASVYACGDQTDVAVLLMVQQNGFVGENLYFNNVQNNGLQLNRGNNAKLTNIGGSVYLSGEDYAPTSGGDMVVVKVVASTGVTIDGLTVDFAGGYALMTFQQEVSVTVINLTVTNGAAAIYMEIPVQPDWWQESWGSFFGDQTVTLEGTLTLGTDVELSEISDANAGDEYTATVTNNATNA